MSTKVKESHAEFGPVAEARYRRTYDNYLESLGNGSSKSLREYCCEVRTLQSGMYSWLRAQGLPVPTPSSHSPILRPAEPPFPMFVEAEASLEYTDDGGTFRDVTVRFPDGAMVRLERGSAKEVLRMLSIHASMSRSSGEEE